MATATDNGMTQGVEECNVAALFGLPLQLRLDKWLKDEQLLKNHMKEVYFKRVHYDKDPELSEYLNANGYNYSLFTYWMKAIKDKTGTWFWNAIHRSLENKTPSVWNSITDLDDLRMAPIPAYEEYPELQPFSSCHLESCSVDSMLITSTEEYIDPEEFDRRQGGSNLDPNRKKSMRTAMGWCCDVVEHRPL